MISSKIVEAIYYNNVNLLDEYFTKYLSDEIPKNNKLPCSSISHITKEQIISKDQAVYSIEKYIHEINPNISTKQITLLHVAATFDSLECFIYLHKMHGLNLRLISADGYFPLHYSCYYGASEVGSYILKHDPEQAVMVTQTKRQFLNLAARSLDCTLIHLLLDLGVNVTDEVYKRNNPISQAIEFRNVNALKIFLENGSKTHNGSPLIYALKQIQMQALPILLDHGEDPTFLDDEGQTPLSIACSWQSVEAVRLLCERATTIDPPLSSVYYKASAVHWACKSYTPEIVKIMLEKGMDVNRLDCFGKSGPTYLLDIGTDENAIQILQMLLDSGLNINLKHEPKLKVKATNTILESFINCMAPSYARIKWLIDHGANPYAITIDGKTPICKMSFRGREKAKIAELMKPFAEELDFQMSVGQ